MIPSAEKDLVASLDVPEGFSSLGIITTDLDDVSYAALDEATKKANVRVVYARSLYGGSSNASTRLAGEFIGILAGTDPEEVKSGIAAAISFMENDAFFYSANDDDTITYFAHCISSTGSYLSDVAGIKEGEALAYLIAPPGEAICGIDEALKRAEVQMKVFYGPPTETNFAGGLLTGDKEDCSEACDAFAETVRRVSDYPRVF